MSLILPQYMVGRNVALCAISGVAVAASGAITGTVGNADLKALGVFRSCRYEAELRSEDIHSADALVSNHQPGVEDYTLTLSELQNAAGGANLMDAYMSSMYFRVAWQAVAPAYGSGSAINGFVFVAYGIRQSIGHGFDENENVVQMVLKPCGLLPYWGAAPSPI